MWPGPFCFVAGINAHCIVLLWASMPTAMSMASTGPLDSMDLSPGNLPPGSQGPGPSQVDRISLFISSHGSQSSAPSCFCGGTSSALLPPHGTSPGSQTCLCLSGLPCGIMVRLCSPSGGSTSPLRLPVCSSASSSCLPSRHGLLTSHLATPCAQGANTSDLAMMALSASPVGSTPMVPLVRAGAAPTTGNTPPPVRMCQHTRV